MGQMIVLLSLLLFYSLLPAYCNNELSLMIVKHGDGTLKSVGPSVEVRIGNNFSLTCKVINTKSGKQFDARVVLGKKKNHLKFQKLSVNPLMFKQVSMREKGAYFCAAPRYKLFKIVYVIVRPKLASKMYNNKPKRSIHYSVELNHLLMLNVTNPYIGSDWNTSKSISTNETEEDDVVQKRPKFITKKRSKAEDMLKITGIVYSVTIAVYTCYHIIKCWCDDKADDSPSFSSPVRFPTTNRHFCYRRRCSICATQTENTPIINGEVGVQLYRSLASVLQTGNVEDLVAHLERYRSSQANSNQPRASARRDYVANLPPSYEEAMDDNIYGPPLGHNDVCGSSAPLGNTREGSH